MPEAAPPQAENRGLLRRQIQLIPLFILFFLRKRVKIKINAIFIF